MISREFRPKYNAVCLEFLVVDPITILSASTMFCLLNKRLLFQMH